MVFDVSLVSIAVGNEENEQSRYLVFRKNINFHRKFAAHFVRFSQSSHRFLCKLINNLFTFFISYIFLQISNWTKLEKF